MNCNWDGCSISLKFGTDVVFLLKENVKKLTLLAMPFYSFTASEIASPVAGCKPRVP
jgi:hypothetical protein